MRAQVSPPDVSSCAIIFLVLGDMAAALIGVSFGGEVASLKLGREGKKSVEGSLAMFCVCFLVAMVFFWDVQLSEYAAVVAAATATLTELYEPLLLDDNLTIPSRAVWNVHAIEQTQLRRKYRVDGVGRPKFDFHTGQS